MDKRPGSIFKSTGATVLSGPKIVQGDARGAQPAHPKQDESTKSSKLPEGRARSSSRPINLGLKVDNRSPSARNEAALPGVPVEAEPSPARVNQAVQRVKAKAAETNDDDLDALLKGLDDDVVPSKPQKEMPHVSATTAGSSESCTSCGKKFEAGQNIYESCLSGEKQILCGACWAKVAPHCVACGEEISGTMAKVGEDIFHQNCLKCTQCRKPIDGQLTKMDCGLVCGACSREIEREIQELRSLLAQGDETGAALIIGGLKGRGINPPEVSESDLGQCSSCQRNFKAGQEVYESPDKKTLCESCYLSNAPKCAACGMPVVGSVARVGESAFHPDCLVCSSCKQKLTGAFVKTDAGFLCSECRRP